MIGDILVFADYVARGRSPDLDDAPFVPDVLLHVWKWFVELSDARPPDMTPISFGEIDAFSRRMDARILPWEAGAIRRVDEVYMAVAREKQKPDDISSRPLSPALFDAIFSSTKKGGEK